MLPSEVVAAAKSYVLLLAKDGDREAATLIHELLMLLEWKDISTAPRNGEVVEVYAVTPKGDRTWDVPPAVTRACWTEKAGWTVDPLRVATHWRPALSPRKDR